MDKPLITFYISTYKHERFIRDAIEGALSQTYSPLEIIISDDCSPDRTFEIAQETVAEYNGVHEIRLNRNEKNLSPSGNNNKINEMAHGELIVASQGDDISLPGRVERVYQVYLKSRRQAMAMFSSRIVIDENGNRLGLSERSFGPSSNDLDYLLRSNCGGFFGCSSVFHKDVFQVFGPMAKDIVQSDRVIPFRAALLGTLHYIQEPLVLYRRHDGNITRPPNDLTSKRLIAWALHGKRLRLKVLENYSRDLQVQDERIKIGLSVRERVREDVLKEMTKVNREIAFIEGNGYAQLRLISKGLGEGVGIIKLVKLLGRLLLPFLYIWRLRKKAKRYDTDIFRN